MCTYLSHTHLARFWARQHVKRWHAGASTASGQAVCACMKEAGKLQICHLHSSRQQTPMTCLKMELWLWQPAWATIPHSHSCQQTEVNRLQTLLCRRWFSFICNLWQFLLFLAQKTCWRSLPSSEGTIKNKESLSIPFEVQFAAVKLQEN